MAPVTKLLLVTFSVVIPYASGHVALTFPPAREYSLDFLDSQRTNPPCGMPKGKDSFL